MRSVFVVFGLICLLMSEGMAVSGLYESPGGRAVPVGFGFAMQMLSVGFILLLQQPFFGARRAGPKPPLRALGALFGILLLVPGAGAAWIGLAERAAPDAAAMSAVGATVLLTALTFIAGSLRSALRAFPRAIEADDA